MDVYKELAKINNLYETDIPNVWKSRLGGDTEMNMTYTLTKLGFEVKRHYDVRKRTGLFAFLRR